MSLVVVMVGRMVQVRQYFGKIKEFFEKFLVIICGIMIPIMLMGKPIYLYCKNKGAVGYKKG